MDFLIQLYKQFQFFLPLGRKNREIKNYFFNFTEICLIHILLTRQTKQNRA